MKRNEKTNETALIRSHVLGSAFQRLLLKWIEATSMGKVKTTELDTVRDNTFATF